MWLVKVTSSYFFVIEGYANRPGPPKTSTGVSSTFFVPWKVSQISRGRQHFLSSNQDKVPLEEKLEQILTWIDLPLEKRPQLILGTYSSLFNDIPMTQGISV
jgi:hypothetical protein